MDQRDSPSTAAITTLSMAVSVAVVILNKIRTRTSENQRHRLNVDLSFLCIGLLGQSSEPALKVIAASSGVTWLTIIILVNEGQSVPMYSKEVVRD